MGLGVAMEPVEHATVLRLALLAPDIVESIVAGKTDQAFMLVTLEQALPGSWEEQRRGLGAA
jgi:hypothetical protein